MLINIQASSISSEVYREKEYHYKVLDYYFLFMTCAIADFINRQGETDTVFLEDIPVVHPGFK